MDNGLSTVHSRRSTANLNGLQALFFLVKSTYNVISTSFIPISNWRWTVNRGPWTKKVNSRRSTANLNGL